MSRSILALVGALALGAVLFVLFGDSLQEEAIDERRDATKGPEPPPLPAVLAGRPDAHPVPCGRADCPHCSGPSATEIGVAEVDGESFPLRGRVLDAESGAPVANARLFLWPRGPHVPSPAAFSEG